MRKHPDIYKVLKTLGLPIYMQGSMRQDENYPELFITYLWFDSSNLWAFDNSTIATNYACQIAIYGVSPDAIDNTVAQVVEVLKNSGYTIDGGGRMISSDEPTHTAWTFDVNFIVKEKNNG